MIRNLIGERINDMTIISYRSYQYIDVKFDNGYIAKDVQYMSFRNLQIRNLLKPSVHGIGYLGGKLRGKKSYQCWHAMIQRCYDPKRLSVRPDYLGCSVDERWHNYQNFKIFYDKNFKEGYQLDKDLIVIGNKVYSEETCSFIPREINIMFSKKELRGTAKESGVSKFNARITINGKRYRLGIFKTEQEASLVFKSAKEDKFKKIATKYKDVIDSRVYDNLMNYSL